MIGKSIQERKEVQRAGEGEIRSLYPVENHPGADC
ncbi:hypothetical protein H0A61_00052 [Koleobacter methoxysyntrophicus]|uniref:Uncharacterized protein n=1 Tax=Koleobacter methoxysyntrophicus TaxID=2751313 RepID=A0A8A0RKG6_9FIRM|nr:hypothetical protein H0A61_00052 [Koleobacter methoxysyntrophicus]